MDDKLYGKELVLDLVNCNIEHFNRDGLARFFIELANLLDMELALVPYFWDEINGGATDDVHLKGISAFHFIETSNIVVHTLTVLKTVFINVFSCKDFDQNVVMDFVCKFFEGDIHHWTEVERRYQ